MFINLFKVLFLKQIVIYAIGVTHAITLCVHTALCKPSAYRFDLRFFLEDGSEMALHAV